MSQAARYGGFLGRSGTMNQSEREEVLDLLLELGHELGKYLRMPLAFLPATASPEELCETVRRTLTQTRDGPRGRRSARQLWTTFVHEAGGRLDSLETFQELEAAVGRALAWEGLQVREGTLSRVQIEADFGAISPAIRAVIQDIEP
jgi:hypothetical protein